MNHIFKFCSLKATIWATINLNCPDSDNSNRPVIEWLENIWSNQNWYNKIFYNPLVKVIIILWVIWSYRNNIIFNNHKCNPIDIIDQAWHMYHYTILYFRNTNMDISSNVASLISIKIVSIPGIPLVLA